MMNERILARCFLPHAVWLCAVIAMLQCRNLSAQDGQLHYEPYTFTALGDDPREMWVDANGAHARFSNIQGLAVDSAGNVFVSDAGNQAIRKVTPAGDVTTIACSSPSSPDLDLLFALAVDQKGTVYVVDAASAVKKVAPDGSVTTLGGFTGVWGVAVDAAGNAYVGDSIGNAVRKIGSDGTVTIVAGSVDESGSADGPAATARFHHPYNVALDKNGNIYVADYDNFTIRKITPDGMVSTLAGLAGSPGNVDGNGAAARFFSPIALTVDAKGSVYVADYFENDVRKITPAGDVTTIATGLTNPSGIGVDANNNIYVAPARGRNLAKITPGGDLTIIAGQSASAPGFHSPRSVAVDPSHNIYVADDDSLNSDQRIYKMSPNGTTMPLTNGVTGNLAVSTSGDVYVANRDAIWKIASDGTTTIAASGSQNGVRQFYPSGIAVDASGKVYFSTISAVIGSDRGRPLYDSTGADTVRMITDGGAVVTLAGTSGIAGHSDGVGPAAQFNEPRTLAVDNANNIYVADAGNRSIRKVTPEGNVTTIAGRADDPPDTPSVDGPGDVARFEYPGSVAVDNSGNIYVVDDTSNSTSRGTTDSALIRKINTSGVVTTLAGDGSYASGAGMTVALSGTGIACDGDGKVYLADTYWGVIRVGQPTSSAQLVNLSTRLQVASSQAASIAGFIIKGSGPNDLLLRGIGPSLGLAGALPDPTLELHRASGLFISNDDWKNQPSNAVPQILAPPNDAESAISARLIPGAYTVILAGKDGNNGVGLVELYELTQGRDTELANLSTRGLVGGNDDVMIGGFITGVAKASKPLRIMLRALGPSLSDAGVAGALTDPILELHDGNGGLLETNDNWKTRSDGSSQQAEIEATGIPPKDELESALIRTLVPGNYTAVMRGNRNATGIGLVEIYNLDVNSSSASPR